MTQATVYSGNEPYIFISYVQEDYSRVMPIVSALSEQHFRLWFAQGGERQEEIDSRLNACGTLLAFISTTSLGSQAFSRLINCAIERRKNPLIVYLDDVEMSSGMRMQFGTVQGIYRRRHSSMESFLEELCRSQVLLPCCSGSPTVRKSLDIAEIAYRRGKEYYDRDLFDEAAWWYRRGADLGHKGAQCELGATYYYGRGNNKDYEKALWWYRKASEQGEGKAMMALGNCYIYGRGVDKNESEGINWYRRSAEAGYKNGQVELAQCYYYGNYVKKDYSEAAKWYAKAAEQGYDLAQLCLADCYYEGIGVHKDYNEAARLYAQAATMLDDAKIGLGKCYFYGRGVPRDYDEAVALFRKVAEHGIPQAQFELGYCYEVGKGVRQNKYEAQRWYDKASYQDFDVDAARRKKKLQK